MAMSGRTTACFGWRVAACVILILSGRPGCATESDWDPYAGYIGIDCEYDPLLAYCFGYSPASGGIHHIRVNGIRWIYASRSVISKYWPYWIYGDEHRYCFDPTPRQNTDYTTYYLSDHGQRQRIWKNFGGIYGAGDPYPNPNFYADICVVEPTVAIPSAIPRNIGDPPVTISYSVLPQLGINLDSELEHPIAIQLHDPANPNNVFIHYTDTAGNGSFEWDGLLWMFGIEGDPRFGPYFCSASTVFATVYVGVRDRYYDHQDYEMYEAPFVFVFPMPGLAVLGPDKGYIGQQLVYVSYYQEHRNGEVQWTSTGIPAWGQGYAYSTRFFSDGTMTVSASASVRGNWQIDWEFLDASWSTEIRDIFMLDDGGKEYNGIYAGNPQFGAYASSLVNQGGWMDDFLNLDGYGNPISGKFNPLWLSLYQLDVGMKANHFRNSKYDLLEGHLVMADPWTQYDSRNLVEHDWRGFMEPRIIDFYEYAEHQDKVKKKPVNCHGESIHGYIGRIWFAAASEVGPAIVGAGGAYTPHLDKDAKQFTYQQGDIIFFGSTVNGASHSARVVTGGSWETTFLWACNVGVTNNGSKAGFDFASLGEYLDLHPSCTRVCVYRF